MRTVFLAVFGDNLARRGGFAPSACYVAMRDDQLERRFRSAGLLKNTQDFFGYAIAYLLNRLWQEDAEALREGHPPACHFVCRNDGFKTKLNEVLHPMEHHGLARSGKSYDGLTAWKKANTLVEISKSSIRKADGASEVALLEELRLAARKHAYGTTALPNEEEGLLFREIGEDE